jgi:steroid delta-isomerase-like uncharacterized protein
VTRRIYTEAAFSSLNGVAMSTQSEALVRRWFDEVWNEGRADAIDALLTDRSIVHGLGADLQGPVGFKTFYASYRDAFPDLLVRIEHIVSDDDLVAVHWSATATHSGGGLGVAATGKPVQFTGMAFIRVAEDKLIEGWNSFDQLGMLQQIGAVALPAS